MLYVALKALHILAAMLFLGTGFGSAWYKWRAWRSGEVAAIAFVDREVVFADWLFTVPSGIVLPATGVAMVAIMRAAWTTPWIAAGVAFYAVAGLTWLPAAVLQLRMRRWSAAAQAQGGALPPDYHRAQRIWIALGVPSFLAAIATVAVMAAKAVPGLE